MRPEFDFNSAQPNAALLDIEAQNFEFSTMEQFILDHAERYKRLVAAFKPSPSSTKGGGSAVANPEIVVSVRVRPMLEDELSQGFPAGIHIRCDTNTIDVHALKQPVRGLPTITVRCLSGSITHASLTADSPQTTPSTRYTAPVPTRRRFTRRW